MNKDKSISKNVSHTFPQKKYKRVIKNVYTRTLISKHLVLEIKNIGSNIKETLEESIKNSFEGKCIVEGFIKPNSSKVITFSSGIVSGIKIVFEVAFECLVCFPVEGQLVNCIAKNITKAGIRAESGDEPITPFVVFIARDHEIEVPYYSTIKEKDLFIARVIGQRFELNDKYISIIAELVEPKKY